MAGLYLHIPFCKSRCIYCAFYSSTLSKLQDSYTEAMCSEMLMRPSAEPIRSIYLGGGTPSVLSADNLNRLFIYINKVYFPGSSAANDPWAGMRDCEITMECNPDDISDEFCLMLRQLPVNRISMGIQTFDNERLRFLRRRHTAEGAVAAMKRLRKAGIANISIDLMFGFPGQTLSQWTNDIDKALAMKPEHISAYSLTYEEGTPLYDLVYNRRSTGMSSGKRPTSRNSTPEGAADLEPVSDELSLSMYELLIDRLTAAGYEHYEISNFAKGVRKHRSLHNSSYWQAIPYIGIGAAAHSYDVSTRSWNVADLQVYIDKIKCSELPSESEVISPTTAYNDMITTALRTCEGIKISNITPSLRTFFTETSATLAAEGLVEVADGHVRLTRKGLFLSDSVMRELIYVD